MTKLRCFDLKSRVDSSRRVVHLIDYSELISVPYGKPFYTKEDECTIVLSQTIDPKIVKSLLEGLHWNREVSPNGMIYHWLETDSSNRETLEYLLNNPQEGG